MRIINPYVEVPEIDGAQLLRNIEKAGRTCYKSEARITPESHIPFIEMIMKSGHHSMFEHEKVTARIICDRGVSHEIVRHRLAAYSQESTRYCNYAGEKFGKEITVIRPFFFEANTEENIGRRIAWETAMENAELGYFDLLDNGASAQEARSVLPNSLKTEIVVTYNLREWRHFFTLRAAKAAHPQMQQIAIPLLLWFKDNLAPLFDDVDYNRDFDTTNYAKVVVMGGDQ
ncbi:FAD-dependent thymidylate synthase [Bacteroides sp.]|uniref:FAD-dependent thymidylate synthase n=1 Tax=Bacteroides sp. TaxID=29523 RepID=UPI0026322993|nr:FAD-dependent thymidylate synthase [Bacteroides sp.]MDD3040423.1 FAD-dependent thymidylate synthase [Bacteroides sp.]